MRSRFSHPVRVHWVLLLLLGCLAPLPALAADQETADLAEWIVEQAGIPKGVCAVLGSDSDLPLEVARFSELLVHAREPEAAQAAALRRQATRAGFGIDRMVVEQGSRDTLPFVDNLIDIVVIAGATKASLLQTPVDEILRALRPEGVAIVGGALAREDLSNWVLGTREVAEVEALPRSSGNWVKLRKRVPQGIDEWTHWEKSPDNNPLSHDQVIQAPYMTQFMSGPFYIGMPSISTAAGGRTFLAIGHIAHHRREWDEVNKIVARNGYNGTVLWERPLEDGYLVHRSAFIATKDVFYMIDGGSSLMLNPASGEELGRLRIPGLPGDWKWMAMQDDVLYVLAGRPEPKTETTKGDRTFGGWSWADLSKGYYGKRIPFGFGDVLAAYSLKENKRLWIHREQSLMDSRAMAMIGGKMFLYCPDRHLRALDSATGDVVWTNADPGVLSLIERPGKGLRSTPGFRTACMNVATPEALIIQGQTRMNVVGISTDTGELLWQKKKYTNNPNAIYMDGQVILGVGDRGSNVALNPTTGEVTADLGFRKLNCTRLTGSGDSLFCRGEGTLRFDRETKQVLVDGGVRPGCNDGAIPAHGLLYIGPWQCDCNLTLIGQVVRCSAGNFRFDHVATDEERLHLETRRGEALAPYDLTDRDWPTLRRDNARSASTPVHVVAAAQQRWRTQPDVAYTPTPPISGGGLVYVGGSDGRVRALARDDGTLRWSFDTNFPIKESPTLWEGRLYFGTGDGFVYCLEAATGKLLWRFRAAPVERHIMFYGNLSSTWPVHTGVLLHQGTAYFAAGILDQDGTYVFALDARTGSIKWQNNSSGHINDELRKGVSAQGNLSIKDGKLLLAGGNQVSPARFDLATGVCDTTTLANGRPKANNGRFVGVFRDLAVISGGRILHAAAENVSTKGSFVAQTGNKRLRMNNGGIPPAWDSKRLTLVNFRNGKLTCLDSEKVAHRMQVGFREGNRPGGDRPGGQSWLYSLAVALQQDGATLWQTDLGQPNKFEVVSLASCPNSVVTVVGHQIRNRAHPQWFATALSAENGKVMWKRELVGKPLPGGLLVDRDGQVVVTMLSGDIVCFGAVSE